MDIMWTFCGSAAVIGSANLVGGEIVSLGTELEPYEGLIVTRFRVTDCSAQSIEGSIFFSVSNKEDGSHSQGFDDGPVSIYKLDFKRPSWRFAFVVE